MAELAKEIIRVNIEDEMRQSYLDYAMSVIVGRALPDVRDGLKPVHRRVLFAMQEANNVWNRAYVKCARIVGDVMGKYHPHGDSSIYDTLVRMAQDFSLRYPLVDGQGNFGSIDGDNAAAMRYTECRLERPHVGAARRPRQGNGRFRPELRREGAGAVGAADARAEPARQRLGRHRGRHGDQRPAAQSQRDHRRVHRADRRSRRSASTSCCSIVPGPDFPTAGIINGAAGIVEAYKTGRGRISCARRPTSRPRTTAARRSSSPRCRIR